MNAAAPQDLTQLAALAAALGWASGMRLYAAVFLTGLAGWLQWVTLPPGLQVLQSPLVLGAAGVMLLLEFIADKVPAVDSLWDAVHTFIRIPAGAALAAGALSGATGTDTASWAVIAALAGGTLAATAHAGKASTRAAVNTSPEPFSNLALSLAGDAAVPGLLWLSWAHPLALFGVLALGVALALGLTFTLWRFVRRKLGAMRR
ncbi:DUF4126 domain-containing protein [Azohydromonas aeria]|uniref:DUF4126 domain-containing protein n=1 Tax=Azohydromonas aeria TaxID=2590212 RepID=UPI0012FB2909|nr:DUF4126 domain-containing protein [Azohydromonas aeria]